ncbi:hypothetical protein ACMZOO_01025 [Catenovulum sp. SX2]|uniref:hypothetical protein n=1 Tax=Catenovulum sp. SX2 TaxID=3398614 RepID=UPI003F861F6D
MRNKQKDTNFVQNERRKGADGLIKAIWATNLLAWLSFIMAMVWFRLARPEKLTGYAKYKKIEDEYRLDWVEQWTEFLFWQLLICCAITLIAMLINLKRMKRKGDHFHYNLAVLLVVAVAAVLYVYLQILPQF